MAKSNAEYNSLAILDHLSLFEINRMGNMIQLLLRKFDMNSCRAAATPMKNGYLKKNPKWVPDIQNKGLISCLTHTPIITYPDVCDVVNYSIRYHFKMNSISIETENSCSISWLKALFQISLEKHRRCFDLLCWYLLKCY